MILTMFATSIKFVNLANMIFLRFLRFLRFLYFIRISGGENSPTGRYSSHLLRGELGLEMISKTARWIYFLFFSKVPCQNIRTSTEGFSPKNFGSFKKCEKLGFLAILAIFGGTHIIFWKTALTIFLIFGKKLLLDKGKKVTEPDFS